MTDIQDLVRRLRANTLIHENYPCEAYNAALTEERAADALEEQAEAHRRRYDENTQLIADLEKADAKIEEQAAEIDWLNDCSMIDKIVHTEVLAEREACARVALDYEERHKFGDGIVTVSSACAGEIAAAIRARHARQF